MNSLVLLASLALGFSTATPATQRSQPIGSLSRVRAIFDRLDLDRDEALSLDEITAIAVPSAHFERHDADDDQCMSRDEFSIYYYYLLVTAAEGVESDLADEVARLHALRLSRGTALAEEGAEVERAAGKPRGAQGGVAESGVAQPGKGTKPGKAAKAAQAANGQDDSLERARALLKKLSEKGTIAKEEARDFRPFLWGGKELELTRAVPAFVRANDHVDAWLAAGTLGKKQARMLRRTLEQRAGAEVVEAAANVPQATEAADAPEFEPVTLGPPMQALELLEVQDTLPLEAPPLDVDMTQELTDSSPVEDSELAADEAPTVGPELPSLDEEYPLPLESTDVEVGEVLAESDGMPSETGGADGASAQGDTEASVSVGLPELETEIVPIDGVEAPVESAPVDEDSSGESPAPAFLPDVTPPTVGPNPEEGLPPGCPALVPPAPVSPASDSVDTGGETTDPPVEVESAEEPSDSEASSGESY